MDPRLIFTAFYGLSLLKKIIISIIFLSIFVFLIYRYSGIDFGQFKNIFINYSEKVTNIFNKFKSLLKI